MIKNKFLRTLSIKPFSFLMLSEVFAQIAFNMLNFILVLIAFNLTKSNSAVAGVILSFTIPAVFFGIIAGVYVDRLNKRNVLILTNFLRALILIPLAFLNQNIFMIYLFAIVVSIISQFFIPAETPMIPVTVKRKTLLLTANAIFGLVFFASVFVAYALSGPVLLFFGDFNVFIFLAILFLGASFFASLVRGGSIKKKEISLTKEDLTVTGEIRTAFAIIRKTQSITRSLLLLTLSQVLILVLAAVGPGYAETVVKIRVEDFPFLFITPAIIGTGLGALIIGNFLEKYSKEKLTKIGTIIVGLSILLLPMGPRLEGGELIKSLNTILPSVFDITSIHLMVFLAFIMGIANSLVFIPSNTLLQENSTNEFRGKIYGALNTLVGLFSFAPVIAAGALADILGVGSVLAGVGILVIVIGFIMIVSERK